MFRRRDEDDYEFPIQNVKNNFGVSNIPASAQAEKPEQKEIVLSRPSNNNSNSATSKPAAPSAPAAAQSSAPIANVTNVFTSSVTKGTTAAQPAPASPVTPDVQTQPVSQPQVQQIQQTQPQQPQVQPVMNTPTISLKTSNPSAPTTNFSVETERRLTVGYGISLEGKVSNCDKLVIYGDVNAELSNVKALQISESGRFHGAAEVEQAEISGNFEGSLRVRKNILINSSGRVNGKITYGSIEIKPGGKFTGEIVEDTEITEKAAEKSENAQELDIFGEAGLENKAA